MITLTEALTHNAEWTYTECVIQSVNRWRIKSTDDRDDSAEVVQLLKDYHYFKDARHDGNTLLQVFCLNDAFLQPECELRRQHAAHICIYAGTVNSTLFTI